uniref:methylamine utilization protein n=1 Tax=Pseudoalteromonas mariniglutinosa TaxID=206042 RepID=UPI00387F9B82
MSKIYLILLLFSGLVTAAQVSVYDENNQPVTDAVVWFSTTQKTDLELPAKRYVMNQKNRAFVPHVLVVHKGSEVECPNLDSIMHHVYSFSATKQFELKLYRDTPQRPIQFTDTGVVELGCNIHDWMLGYVVVVDSLFFAKTDQHGVAEMTLPVGDYKLSIWHHRFADISRPETQLVSIGKQPVRVQLQHALLPEFNLVADEFDEYE